MEETNLKPQNLVRACHRGDCVFVCVCVCLCGLGAICVCLSAIQVFHKPTKVAMYYHVLSRPSLFAPYYVNKCEIRYQFL